MNFMGISADTWFPVITLIIGAMLKAIFDAASDRRVRQRDREARKEQRLDAIHIRRIEFQRATLLELQEIVSQLARFTGQSHHQDLIFYKTTGEWGTGYLTEETNQGFLESQTSMNLLRVRIEDESIRILAKDFSTACVRAVLARSEDASFDELKTVNSISTQLHEKIGDALRKLDDEDYMQ